MSLINLSPSGLQELIITSPVEVCNRYLEFSPAQQVVILKTFQEKRDLLPRLNLLKENFNLRVKDRVFPLNRCWAAVQLPLFSNEVFSQEPEVAIELSKVRHFKIILDVLDTEKINILVSLKIGKLTKVWNEIKFLQLEERLLPRLIEALKDHITQQTIDETQEFAEEHRIDTIAQKCYQKRADDLIIFFQKQDMPLLLPPKPIKKTGCFPWSKKPKNQTTEVKVDPPSHEMEEFKKVASKMKTLVIDEKNGKQLNTYQISDILAELGENMENLTINCDEFREFVDLEHMSNLKKLSFNRNKTLKIDDARHFKKLESLEINGKEQQLNRNVARAVHFL